MNLYYKPNFNGSVFIFTLIKNGGSKFVFLQHSDIYLEIRIYVVCTYIPQENFLAANDTEIKHLDSV